MKEHYIEIQKKARYYSLGGENANKLLVVLHGYGQQAQYFIQKFKDLSSEWKIIAPEATHRFYLEGFSGRVGTTWMTKELRHIDIEENHQYLESLLNKIISIQNYEEIVVLGFSQGAATAARWYYSTKQKINRLIIWASVFPPDIDLNFVKNEKNNQKNVFVLGDKDPFFNENQKDEVTKFFESLNYEIVKFEGNHDIDSKTLLNII